MRIRKTINLDGVEVCAFCSQEECRCPMDGIINHDKEKDDKEEA